MTRLQKLLIPLVKLHGVNEGELMHTKCPLCVLWRVIESKRTGIKLRGFWRQPTEYLMQVKGKL